MISHGSVTALWRQTQSFLGRKYCIGQIYISILCSWHYQKSMNIQFTPAGTAQATTFLWKSTYLFLISLILRKKDHASKGLTKYEYQHLSACFIDGNKKAEVFATVWATDWEKDRREWPTRRGQSMSWSTERNSCQVLLLESWLHHQYIKEWTPVCTWIHLASIREATRRQVQDTPPPPTPTLSFALSRSYSLSLSCSE